MIKIKTYKAEKYSELIERIWVLENLNSETELIIPPNQYLNLIFPINGSGYQRNQKQINTPQIEGISTQNTHYLYPTNTILIGIRFYAYGLFPFVQALGKNLLNTSIENQINNKTVQAQSNLSNFNFLYKLLDSQFCEDSYQKIIPLLNFYKQYRWAEDTSNLQEFCEETHTNYTSLNRNFTKIIGISPKKFERLIKFRKSLCSLIDSKENLTSIGLHSGYFDQAHFIREFKLFLNQTPSSYKKLIELADKESQIINYNFKLY